ncbi:MAG TPA: hypothetical protein VJN18_23880 [Polyangiaceae bacterium]|nr:hypothetical protein [Polyangiaceae bacterium]
MPVRRPRGYLGEDHETIGSDILAVLKILKMPEQVLGKQEWERLQRVKAGDWYPIEHLLGLMEILEAHVGPYGLMQMGRRLFDLSHKDRVKVIAKSARDIVYGIDDMYHHANKGRGIGGWKVIKFEPGLAELEKNTPHHCVMDQGMLTEALLTIGCATNVTQTKCFRDGADVCIYQITSAFIDQRWSGEAPKR